MPNGKLVLNVGPMFSGKTTELLRLFERKTHAGVPCILVKFAGDNRYSNDHVVSHKDAFGNCRQMPSVSLCTLRDLEPLLNDINTVFIDEVQFFPDKEYIAELLNRDINVTASGLNGDWRLKMFPGMADLFAMAYDIKMFQSVCGFCKSENACYSKKIIPDKDGIGGSEMYRAACRDCYVKI
jgi:thymidine kinase